MEAIKEAWDAIPGPAKKVIVVFVVVVCIALYYDGPKLFPFLKYTPVDVVKNNVGVFYNVDRVVDGDTLVVDINGSAEKVRLIGINTPETVDPNKPVECFGQEATDEMKSLADGKIVRLEYDDSQGIRDTYGRLLAYVYLEDGEMLNRKMVADGYAYEYTYITPYKYQKEFRDLQILAKINSRGIWSPEACPSK